MIRVEINSIDLPKWAFYSVDSYTAYVVNKLKEAGVPTIGPILNLDIDYSKGILTKFEDPSTLNDIYIWKENNASFI